MSTSARHLLRTSLRASTLALAVVGLMGTAAAETVTLDKLPNGATSWSSLGGNSPSYVYANSFVATITGTVKDMGAWLSGGPADLKYQIYSSLNGNVANGPDSGNVLASTGVIAGQNHELVEYVGGNTTSSAVLTAGQTYWFAATTVGLPVGAGAYSFASHLRNSGGINDNGSFWYSNSPTGQGFVQNQSIGELAFHITQFATGPSPVPEPGSLALMLAGLGVIGTMARRRT